MNFKKRVNGLWTNIPFYIYKIATDTITTLPAVLYPNDTTATVGLKGNTVQFGTPSPDNPIQPSECGERTRNLFDVSTATNEFLNSNGSITSTTAGDLYYLSDYISADNVTISVQFKETAAAEIFTVGIYDSSKSFIRRDVISNNSVSYENVAYIRINYRNKNCQNAMVNTGSTPLPYEPYGIKIPISSANTTTPIYLGEVETTRKIRKLVLTGEENWEQVTAGDNTYIRLDIGVLNTYIGDTIVCTHCGYADISSSTSGYGCDILNSVGSGRDFLCFRLQGYQGNTIFKQYLEAQYAEGTPVTVWYVLVTAETAVINEPLMKIGDYADTVSGITIPTIAGANSFDVLTTLKPSEVTVNYKGWHDATVKEWDGGQWNE